MSRDAVKEIVDKLFAIVQGEDAVDVAGAALTLLESAILMSGEVGIANVTADHLRFIANGMAGIPCEDSPLNKPIGKH